MTTESLIFLAGASRGVGREVAQLLRSHAIPVKALLRSEATRAELEAKGVTIALGDAMQPEQVKQAMSDTPIRAVISTIGGLPEQGERPDYLANRNLIDAAVRSGVQRFILVSSIGTGDSAVAIPERAMEVLGPVLAEKEKAEKYLIESGLTYTIIRPGGLKSEPATGNGVLTEDFKVSGTIHRADVAHLVYQCLGSDRAHHKVLSAIDRTMAYGQPSFEEFKL